MCEYLKYKPSKYVFHLPHIIKTFLNEIFHALQITQRKTIYKVPYDKAAMVMVKRLERDSKNVVAVRYTHLTSFCTSLQTVMYP